MDISVILVNFNTKALLRQCIESIYEFTFDINYEIIVVDNKSHDGSVDMLKELFPKVKCLNAYDNLGFGKGNNLGVKSAIGDFVFLLNSDTLLRENSLKILHEFFIKNEKSLNIGVLGCELIDDEKLTINSGGGFPWVMNDFKEYFYVIGEKLLKRQLAPRDPCDFKEPFFEIDYVIGADMFLRRALYEQVGGFDENYFMYYEESDMQMQIRKMGYKCYITTATKIIHLEGGSTNREKFSPVKRLINQKSRNYYFKKNDKKHYVFYILMDMAINVTRVFNRRYRFKENIKFIKENIKSY